MSQRRAVAAHSADPVAPAAPSTVDLWADRQPGRSRAPATLNISHPPQPLPEVGASILNSRPLSPLRRAGSDPSPSFRGLPRQTPSSLVRRHSKPQLPSRPSSSRDAQLKIRMQAHDDCGAEEVSGAPSRPSQDRATPSSSSPSRPASSSELPTVLAAASPPARIPREKQLRLANPDEDAAEEKSAVAEHLRAVDRDAEEHETNARIYRALESEIQSLIDAQQQPCTLCLCTSATITYEPEPEAGFSSEVLAACSIQEAGQSSPTASGDELPVTIGCASEVSSSRTTTSAARHSDASTDAPPRRAPSPIFVPVQPLRLPATHSRSTATAAPAEPVNTAAPLPQFRDLPTRHLDRISFPPDYTAALAQPAYTEPEPSASSLRNEVEALRAEIARLQFLQDRLVMEIHGVSSPPPTYRSSLDTSSA
ncbi:hypothetical protein PUNSTDRAFT_138097 [Punctularia strigosozonata HHB-11173 SS5]|uniref:Uncharacterized protein n=1 Tax=Punctularia strigosozonata (strain HHB-11173) TaxID=741275 RepID=R7S4T9_PUNST|nr:uncharacterized protein PUNSTDRAFT_138097 [Punctularia strigosozonata HHB-11173 SS5]EIN04904.1 hypothetical protein PUNSTDRAFT_138097 [Punctularia strigosozonata HHB-11173 SS5]